MNYNDMYGIDITPANVWQLRVLISPLGSDAQMELHTQSERESNIRVKSEITCRSDMRDGLAQTIALATSLWGTEARCCVRLHPNEGAWSYTFHSQDDLTTCDESILATDATLPELPVVLSMSTTGRKFLLLNGRLTKHFVTTIEEISVWRRGERAAIDFVFGQKSVQCACIYNAAKVNQVVDYVMPDHNVEVKTDLDTEQYWYRPVKT